MKKLDIIFIDGVDTSADANSYLTYLFPIAAMLEQNNYSFGILNIQTIKDFSLEKIILELKRYECNIVGMTTTADNIYNVSLISQRIAQEDNYKIILGGAQATFDDIKTIISTNCDVIIRGEGDYTIIKLLNHFIKGIGFLSHIDGITYKDKTEIKRNVNLKLFDPNELPIPQYKIASDSKYWLFPQDFTEKESKDFFKAEQISNKYFISSRGCPYSCIFCVEGNHSSGLREKKPERVLQELDYFVECVNDNIIVISDSTFTSSYKRVIEICNKIKELRKKHEIYWYAEGRANILAKHPDLISIMKNAGLIALQIGIESGSQEVLDIQNKRISLNDMRVVAKEIAKVENVMLIGNIILGQSGDNESTYQESLLFIEELLELADFNLFISSGYLVPYVGTLIREKSKDFNLNILIDEFEYNQYSGYEYPICLPNNLSLSELENWKIIFNNTIYDFINKKLRQKSKKEIDRHIKWCLELEKKRISIKTPWYNTFMSSEIVKRYYELYFQDTTVTDYSEDNLSKNLDVIYPIALWEVMYNFQNDTWFISTFNGVIKLMEYELDLLNLANGKNSLQNIMNICRDKDNDCLTILNFYIKMCDNYELLFKRYF